MAQLLDGKTASRAIRVQLKKEIKRLRERASRPPHLVFIQVGAIAASTTYVNAKHRMARRIGCLSSVERFPAETSQEALLNRISELNSDPAVHAVLVQLPLPPQISEQAVAQAISPLKDVDCFHPENFGRMAIGLPGPRSATPQGVMLMLEHYGIEVAGLNAVVLGRSNLVGKPMGILLLSANATVTSCHSRTRNLAEICRSADLIVSAAGRAALLKGDMVKPGAVVVDVGTNFVPEYDENGETLLDETGAARTRLVGDVEFETVSLTAGWISPVPGGVGPMTIASVLYNAVELYRMQEGLQSFDATAS